MKIEGKTFLASSFLHLALLVGATYLPLFSPKPQMPIMIDFTMEQGQHAEHRDIKGDSGASQPQIATFQPPSQKIVPVANAAPEMPVVAAKPVNEVVTATPSSTGMSPPAIAVAPTAGVATAQPGKIGNGSQVSSSGSDEKNPGKGTGSHGDSVASEQTRYQKERFAYIRNAIAENLQYPVKARKMGWSGKIAIEFVILESGAVDKIRITKSSGIPLLDKDAVETVRRSGPFPKPPVSARLVIPLEYALK